MPTGVALRDARQQLFDAAERVLLRAGPGALTSRAVTTEAGVVKGVLHRHFEDFDAFLAGLVEDRMARIGGQSAALCEAAGTGTVVGNLTGALSDLFGSAAAAIIPLIIFRDELRARLRQARRAAVPVLAEATAMIARYLAAEQEAGRIAAGADIDALAPTLIGAGHLLDADRKGAPPEAEAVRKVVSTVVASVLAQPPECRSRPAG